MQLAVYHHLQAVQLAVLAWQVHATTPHTTNRPALRSMLGGEHACTRSVAAQLHRIVTNASSPTPRPRVVPRRYREALDAALATRQPEVVASVLEELAARGGLAGAVGGRDAAGLLPLLKHLVRYIVEPRYTRLLGGVAHRWALGCGCWGNSGLYGVGWSEREGACGRVG